MALVVDSPAWIRSLKGLQSWKEVIMYTCITINRRRLSTPINTPKKPGSTLSACWYEEMSEMYTSVRMGTRKMVLKKYSEKFTSGNTLFMMELGRLSCASFQPNKPMTRSVRSVRAKMPMLMDKNMFGICYIK